MIPFKINSSIYLKLPSMNHKYLVFVYFTVNMKYL